MKSNHAKLKNTGILFELLVRQATSDIISEKESKAVNIIRRFFKEGTELNKELKLYKTLTEDKYHDARKAENFIEVVLSERKKINNTQLKSETYNLVKAINEAYTIDFYQAKINNYKVLASTYNLFEYVLGRSVPPTDVVNSKFTILEHIAAKQAEKNEVKDKVLEAYDQQDKDIRLLAYKLMIEKYNQKYNALDNRQKRLLREYINSVTDSPKLAEFVNNEANIVKFELKKLLKKVDDEVMQVKLEETINQIDKQVICKSVKEDHILQLMKYYELVKELQQI